MSDAPSRSLDLAALLEEAEAASPLSAADVVGDALGRAVGARAVSFLIADYSGRNLIRLGHVEPADAGAQGRERAQEVPLAGTPHGEALATQSTQIAEHESGWRVVAPVTSRGEAVGVLELAVDEEPGEDVVASVSGAAHVLAYIVIANRRYTDLFEWGQRSLPLSLEAEIQHRLLPGSYTCEGGQFTLAGWLEPAGDVGGDTFDFSVERDTLHLSMTDAMGHTVKAALLATVLVGALRNGRRRGMSLHEQAAHAQAALRGYTDDSEFVTGQVARIDLSTGAAAIVNAGHPPPILIRDGRATTVPLTADPPFGIPLARAHRVQELRLAPGDRLVFLTDGMLERNAASVDTAALLNANRHRHPREAVQDVVRRVVDACDGKLEDDATVLCLDWHGGPTARRDTAHGADR